MTTLEYKKLILEGPKTLSVGEYYLRRFKEHKGDQVAMVQEEDGTELTYSELLRRSKCVSGLLRHHNVGSGDSVMLCCYNTLEAPPVTLGTLFIGATLAPVNPVFHSSDLVHMMGYIQPKVVIYNKLAAPAIQEALTLHKPTVTPIPMEMLVKSWQDDSYLKDFHLGVVEDTDKHVAMIMCSSGTTGRPKGIEMTHLRFLSMQYVHLYPEFAPGSEIVILSTSYPFWSPKHYTDMFGLCEGYKIIQSQSFEIEKFLTTIQKYKVSLCFITSGELIPIANYPSTDKYDLSSLRNIVYWGTTISQQLLDTAAKKLRCPITNVYGMAESGGMLRPAYDVRDKPGNVGKLGENMKVKVIDMNTGRVLGPNSTGELCFLSWTSFKAYRGNPQATKDTFDDEGYLRTGDLGYYDDDGFFYIVDRIKELFRYKFIHVAPSEIEEVLMRHPAVLEAAVVGIKHELDVDHARAFIVLRKGARATEEELVTFVKDTLPIYKWLHGGVRFLDALPRNSTGKVQTFQLRKSEQIVC